MYTNESNYVTSPELSFRSNDEDYEDRSRSKMRKKNKHGKRGGSGYRKINKNGTKLTFCRFCNPTLAIRIHNKYIIKCQANGLL